MVAVFRGYGKLEMMMNMGMAKFILSLSFNHKGHEEHEEQLV